MQTIDTIARAVETNLDKLAAVFNEEINDFFFTEKELHSYFYHLCMRDGIFHHKGYSLIHTEYPSPFKCSFGLEDPFVTEQDIDSKTMRAHVDCVFLNPLFIDWLSETRSKYGMKPLLGIGNNRFDLYILDFYRIYADFNAQTHQPVLAYAIEFKYARQSYAGTKYPLVTIHQDLCKLRLLRDFKKSGKRIDFVNKTQAVIFVGDRSMSLRRKLSGALEAYPNTDYRIIARRAP